MSLRHAAARLSALLLLLALASGPAAAAGREEKVDVVIVGAGVSGLMAARTLEGAGHKVVVLEAQDRVGGRLQRAKLGSGDRTAWVDLGGQWMGTNHSRLQALVKELGIKSFDVPTGGKDTFLYDGRRTLHNYAWPSVPYNASQLERPWPEVNFTMEERDDVVETWKQVEALAATIDAERPWDSPNATELDTMTISTWVQRTAKTAMGAWWVQVMCENWGGLGAFEPGAASMLHLAWSQKVSPQRQTPEAYLFDGAAGQLPIKLASQLSSRVRTGDPVDWIKQDDGGVTAVTAAGRRYRGKAAILAMPPHQTGRVRYSPPMPGIRDQLTQRSPMGAIIKVLVAYSTPWWRAKQLSGLAIGNLKTIELVADSTNPSPGSAAVLATFITGPRATRLGQASPESRKQAVLDDLAELLGEEARQPIDYREGNWPDNPWIGGAYTTFYTPGTWTQFGEALRRPVGRVFWAGTEMSTVWPGYIDGAIRAGEKAAQDASELL